MLERALKLNGKKARRAWDDFLKMIDALFVRSFIKKLLQLVHCEQEEVIQFSIPLDTIQKR